MITNDDKNWHYLAVKSLSRLLGGITSNHDGDFYCLNCLHSCRTENKHKRHEKVLTINLWLLLCRNDKRR